MKTPVTRQLKAVLEATARLGPVILTNAHGRPWRANSFCATWRRYRRKAGNNRLTFHDLRRTAVTRLAEAGCTDAETATITGMPCVVWERSSSAIKRAQSSRLRLSPSWRWLDREHVLQNGVQNARVAPS